MAKSPAAVKSKSKASSSKSAPVKSTLSTEYVASSDEAEDEVDEQESSSEEEEDLPAIPIPAAKSRTSTTKATKPVATSSKPIVNQTTAQVSPAKKPTQTNGQFTSTEHRRPSEGLKLPPRFYKVDAQTAPSCDIFKSDSLADKQVFYITTPAKMSLEKVKQLSWKAAQGGEQVYSTKSTSYTVELENSGKKGLRVMLPTKSGYKSVHSKVDQILHFQEAPNLPELKRAAENEGRVYSKKPKREQPKGLKMRFRPMGFVSGSLGTLGESDSEVEVEANGDVEMMDAPPAHLPSPPKEVEDDIPKAVDDVEITDKPIKEKKKKDKSKSKVVVDGEEKPRKEKKHKDKDKEKSKKKKDKAVISNVT